MPSENDKNSIFKKMRDTRERFLDRPFGQDEAQSDEVISAADFRLYKKLAGASLQDEKKSGERAPRSAVQSAVEEYFDDSALSEEIFGALGGGQSSSAQPETEEAPEDEEGEPVTGEELLGELDRMAGEAVSRHTRLLRKPKIVYDPYNEILNKNKGYVLDGIPELSVGSGYEFSQDVSEPAPKKKKRRNKR